MTTNATRKSVQPGPDQGQLPERNWQSLRTYSYYRILLSLFLFAMPVIYQNSQLGSNNALLYWIGSFGYILLGIASVALVQSRLLPFQLTLHSIVISDILALTLMTHASAGLTSGLGVLIVISVAACGSLTRGRQLYFYAAIGSLALLVEQIVTSFDSPYLANAYTQAGFYGLALFASAFLLDILSQRLTQSEALARQRGIDLANMEQVNEYIIQNLKSGLILLDENDRVRLINKSGRYLLHTETQQAGTHLSILSPELARQLTLWRETGATGKPFQVEADAETILPRFARLDDSNKPGHLVFLDDSSDITQQSQQIKLASLGRLTASIAHEIRNPLGAISHANQLLSESDALADADQRLIEIIRKHSGRMNTIIENVLQLSRRDYSHPDTFRLEQWLQEFAEEFRDSNKLDDSALTIDINPDDTMISFDPSHLHQILWNLCMNSLNYGQQENAPPHILLQGGSGQPGRPPYLDVIDEGPGIPEKDTDQIFEPFHTINQQGTGLGLYISRELAECNKSRLNYIHRATGGSCFRLSFRDTERSTL